MNEAGNSNGNSGRRRAHIDDDDDDDYEIDDRVHKSKNLDAERRRRKKLNDRLLELRSLVPHITNMNKGTIVTDAITYIEELEKSATDLRNQLLEMEATVVEESKLPIEAIDAAEEIKNWGIEPEIKVNQIDRNKLWIKMVFQQKRGGFTKLVEAVSVIGYEFTDTSVTTSRGAILVTACLEGNHGGILEPEHVRELLLEIMRGI
ncbi:transcription factor DYT1 [Rhododendron vialii]|uniref:transcription factor DYT1 n=1 Tax=Rhododendron vialii TaxID=182163 RepID=UPI00265F539B|nr:transcription factor DYT1 [Rhododendron vialii]